METFKDRLIQAIKDYDPDKADYNLIIETVLNMGLDARTSLTNIFPYSVTYNNESYTLVEFIDHADYIGLMNEDIIKVVTEQIPNE